MRVTFLTQDDPLYILPFFEALFAQDLGEIEITSVFACRSMGNRKRTKLLGELIRLYGASGFAKLAALQVWKRTASALNVGRLNGRSYSLRELVEGKGLPYCPIGNPNADGNFQTISAYAPEMIVSVACPFILKRRLLDVPARAAINIHHAPLPSYRGMMPTFWQMYHGEKSVGITIHTMGEELDRGEIVYQDFVPVFARETMHQLIRRSKRAGAHAMLEVLRQYAAGRPPVPVPPRSESSCFTFPTATEMRAFRDRGLRAI